MQEWFATHQRSVSIGITIGAVAVLAVAAVVGGAILIGQPPAASATPTGQQSSTSQPTDDPSSTPITSESPVATPVSTPPTSTSASFNLLPAEQPADFVPQITCSGSIGASDPVAIVQLHAAVEFTGDIVLRDYADVTNPRTVCDFGGIDPQLIDARHALISTFGPLGTAHAVVDLPEVRYHWFRLPATPGWGSTLITVSPGLDQIVWESVDPQGSGTDTLHITTAAGDQVVATLRDTNTGRCGSPEDSSRGAYTRSGSHLYVLNQPFTPQNSLLVIEDTTALLSVIPPTGDWPSGAHPSMAVWSPTSASLFYRQDGDVFRWTTESGVQPYLPGVTWYYPTISPDGSLLAYAVVRANSALHDVYLVDLAHEGSPERIGEGARTQPAFLNSDQLWLKAEGEDHGCAGSNGERPLIYNVADGSESPSIIDRVIQVWPATSSN